MTPSSEETEYGRLVRALMKAFHRGIALGFMLGVGMTIALLHAIDVRP